MQGDSVDSAPVVSAARKAPTTVGGKQGRTKNPSSGV